MANKKPKDKTAIANTEDGGKFLDRSGVMDGPCSEFYMKRDNLWKNFMMTIISNVLSVSFGKQKIQNLLSTA